MDLLLGAGRVDDDDPVAGDDRDLLVGLGDRALQVEALRLEAVFALRPSQADLGVDLQEQRQVGPEAVGGGVAEADHLADAEPPRRTLVGDARIGEAVGDDVVARLERRADHPLGEVGAGREEEHQLGQRLELGRRIGEQRRGSSPPRRSPPARGSRPSSQPSASTSRRAWVLLPEPSTPSREMNTAQTLGAGTPTISLWRRLLLLPV